MSNHSTSASSSAKATWHKAEKAGSDAANSIFSKCHAGHVLMGVGLGSLAGHMDRKYIEPFCLIIGGSLLMVQMLDHEEYCKMSWNDAVPKSRHSAHTSSKGSSSSRLGGVVEEAMEFAANNACMAASYAGAYALTQYM